MASLRWLGLNDGSSGRGTCRLLSPLFGFGLELLLGLTGCMILGELVAQSELHLPSEG